MTARLFVLALLLSTAAVAQTPQRRPQPPQEPPPEIQPERVSDGLVRLSLFEGETSLRLAKGGEKRVTVVVREWAVAGGQTIARFPVSGLAIFQLSGGSVTTEINGKRLGWSEGGSWSVAPGSSVAVQTGTDTALIRTVEFRGLEK